MSSLEALITPSVIRWARESAGLTVQEAAKKLKRPVEDIEAWESGDKRPSITQARKASELYRRPLAAFYLPEPPKDFEILRDYRSLPLDERREYSPKLLVIIRTAIEHQQWTREFLIAEGTEPLSFVGSANIHSLPNEVAINILQTLDVTPDEQYSCRTRDDALRLWMRKAERKGIFIFREGQVDLRECRGFVISDEYAPFVYLNSEDARAAQLFTLVHELTHIWLDQSGISNLSANGLYNFPEASTVEAFCNKVASEALLVRTTFVNEWLKLNNDTTIENRIEKLSDKFKISEEAIARRLLEDGRISNRKYDELRDYYQDRWRKLKDFEKKRLKEAEGGPSFYIKKLSNNGYAYTQTVASAFKGGQISGREASSLLGVKVNHIPKLALAAGFPLSVKG